MISFGIIGTGWITASFIAGAHATSKWNLATVYSRSAESAKHFAAKYDQKINIHTEISSLATDPSISAVYIASPNSYHYKHAKEILEGGKHVILEKPATSNAKELDELFKIAKEKGVFLIEAYRHIHEVNFKILKGNLPRLGKIYGASLNYAQYSSRYDNALKGEVPNIFNLEYAGGALVDLGVYCIAAAVELFGEPRQSQYFPVMIPTGADGGGNLILTYDNFSVSINASKIWNSEVPSEVYGEKGTLVVPTITDIARVVYLDPKKKGEREELGKEKEKEHLNLKEEAAEYARVIEEMDLEAVKKYEKVSRGVIKVTEGCRRANGLLFPMEK
ncbi:oxidoreductase-like protein [Zopfia rhizophila CBS 207.26]|uniref:Oxidoreductase-like protein n=1 Tax=Zopfia rhizophila CBS 207.26 TaxID=1314779 RepID=A0A6A6DRA5_9PEZI|nr:oxidoreductase-like protein [Zopfia rhizophila CBS 207.26]